MRCVRFHVSTGPASLFERVRYKFREPRILRIHAEHFRDRAAERTAPISLLQRIDANEWELVTVEARADTGKFVSTAWRRRIEGTTWWIVIGFHDTVQTVFASERKTGMGPSVITAGPAYDFVDRTNARLMMDEGR